MPYIILLFGLLLPAPGSPAVSKVKFETSAGDFVVEVHRDWAPIGADHFQELVAAKFFDQFRFYRVVKRFVVQWGVNGEPLMNRKWGNLAIRDDLVTQRNLKGTIVYAKDGANSRTSMVFVNFADNQRLDS